MASGGSAAWRSYPKEWLALEARLRDAAPLIQALANGVPHARVRLSAALGQVAETCGRVRPACVLCGAIKGRVRALLTLPLRLSLS